MNKKIIGIVIGAVLVLVIGGLITLKKKGIEPVKGMQALVKPSISLDSPAKFLPKSTVMFYSISDLSGIWKQIQDTNFWNQFSKLPLWADFGIKENMFKMKTALEARLGFEITESRIMDLLGNRLIFAVAMNSESKEVKVIFQSYVGKKTQVVESMLKSFPEKSAGANPSTAYQGENIVLFPPNTENDPEIRYVLVNNVLTIGFGKAEAELKQIIDLTKESKESSLYDDKNYQEIAKKLAGDKDYHSFYYSDFSKISNMLPELIKPLIDAQPEQFAGLNIEDIAKTLSQIKMAGGKAIQTKTGFSMVSKVIPDFDKMTDEQKKSWNTKPNKLDSLQFIADDTILVNATGNVNLTKIWDTVTTASKGQDQNMVGNIVTSLQEFEKTYNINLKKDIIEKIGDELSFVFTGLSLEGMFPIPKIGFILKSNDSKNLVSKITDIITQTLKAQESAMPLAFKEIDIQGNTFQVLQTPLGEGLSPVIGSFDSWVIIATNKITAEKYLETSKSKLQLLSKTEGFKSGIPDYSNNVARLSYANLSAMTELIKSTLNWVMQRKDMIPQTDQVQAVTSTISSYAEPLLNTFKVFQGMGFISYNESETAVQEINLVFKDIK